MAAAYEADGASAHDLLARAHTALRHALDVDPQLSSVGKLLTEAMINTQEAAESLRHYLEALDVDPARQEEIERRTAALEALGRKHRVGVLELPEQLARTERELAALDNAQVSLGRLEAELDALTRDYRAAARRLTEARQAAAARLGNHITKLMQGLGMAGGRFAVSVTASGTEIAANIMKMMTSTRSTSVNGVILISAITSPSCRATTDVILLLSRDQRGESSNKCRGGRAKARPLRRLRRRPYWSRLKV